MRYNQLLEAAILTAIIMLGILVLLTYPGKVTPPGSLAVHVTDAGGNPLAGFQLSYYTTGTPPPVPDASWVTNSTGWYVWPGLAPKDYTVRVLHHDNPDGTFYAETTKTVTVPIGSVGTADVTLVST